MEIRGKIIYAGEVRQGVSQKTGKEWRSQECVLETLDKYPERLVFQHYDTSITLGEGDMVRGELRFSARDYNGRWYNQLYMSRPSLENGKQNVHQDIGREAASPKPQSESDDLPF